VASKPDPHTPATEHPMAASRTQARAIGPTTLRHVWLAGLGVVAVAQREMLAAPAHVVARAGAWQAAAVRTADGARNRVRDEVLPQVAGIGARIEAHLAPVFERFGLIHPERKSRKATGKTRRPQARRNPSRAPKKSATSRR